MLKNGGKTRPDRPWREPNMLKSFKLHNFKTFLNTEFAFAPRNLLLGKNTSGKTNLVKALQFLSTTALSELDRAAEVVPGGISEICNWRLESDTIEMECICELDFEGEPFVYKYELNLIRQSAVSPAQAPQAGLRVVEERLTIDGPGFSNAVLLENNGHEASMADEERLQSGEHAPRPRTLAPKNATMLSKLYELETNRRAMLFREHLHNWAYFSISPLAIRMGMSDWPRPYPMVLDSLGQNLSNSIFLLKNIDERRYRRLIEHVHIVEPSLQSIQFFFVPDRSPVPFVELERHPRASWNGLSDGTLRALALALIIELSSTCSPPDRRTPCLAIIEEPENGLFPGQLRKFFDLFEEWAPAAQFIFTSHSPYFIDMFDDKRDCVIILRKAADRSEIVRPTPAAPLDAEDRLTLSTEYAAELFE